ncbi:uncharacterized protein METZ01_LOCUS78523 [marine metagenome]|uniref:Uncharacterized protein n=1 Tax=marine metagenome TaxID=408172 RepID=A0A381UBZ6_9ZZZZ
MASLAELYQMPSGHLVNHRQACWLTGRVEQSH